MKKSLLALASLACLSLSAHAANVALGSTVSLTGTNFGNSGPWCCGSLAAPGSVVDGTFLANGAQWNVGTVFWSGALGADSINITLAGAASVSHIDLQADNNDDYAVAYRDIGGTWHSLVTISPHRSWGLDMGAATFAPVVATAFSISAAGGDGYYAVSEFQAIGTPVAVPEPETYALMLAGLGVVAWVGRRRRT